MTRLRAIALAFALAAATCHAVAQSHAPAEAELKAARADEQRRIETIARITPAVVCIYDSARRGGGSGVLIDAGGYGLTNFHVVAGMLDTRQGLGGLSDGQVYELQVLGIDPTGDVAMFRLLGPDKSGSAMDQSDSTKDTWACAELGDSDAVHVGQLAIAAGNPFVLAEDHTPTITLGRVTGVGRYQKGQGNALVYTDCIQTDAAINPGNSGGPLFDIDGRVIGINGRISIAAGVRGRFNVGLGYAISANQIKRFLPAMRAGLFVRHGTLQATVNDALVFNDMLEDGPAWKIGIRPGDKLLRFGGKDITSANHFASVLGVYPEDWPVPVTYEHAGNLIHRIARLEALSVRQKAPFEVDPAVNRSAMERVLSRYRFAAGSPTPSGEAQISWTSARRRAGEEADQRWMHTYVPDGSSVHRQLHDDGSVRREVVCRDDQAQLVDSGQTFALAPLEALPWIGLHAFQRRLAFVAAEVDPEPFQHVGGDELLSIDANGRPGDSRLLEVLEFRTEGGIIIRIGFDVVDGLVRQVRAFDPAANLEAKIRLGEFVRASGAKQPTRVEVECGDIHYVDVLTYEGSQP